MPVPDFQSLMLSILTALAGGADTSTDQVRQRVAATEGLTPEAVHELLPSGKVTKFANRVGWAFVHMGKAGLVERTRRGFYRLTAEGTRLLAAAPSRIDMKFLLTTYPVYATWRHTQSANPDSPSTRPDEAMETPEEVLDHAAAQVRQALEADVLDRVRAASPAFLEGVVVDLLIAMGYGGGDPARGG